MMRRIGPAKVMGDAAHDRPGPVVSSRSLAVLTFGGVLAATACDPNVMIGARWNRLTAGAGGEVSAAGTTPGGSGGGAGTAVTSGGTSDVGDGGALALPGGAAGEAGAGGAPAVEQWCVTAPWLNKPVVFKGEAGNVIPAGKYLIRYMGGAQRHDGNIGFEVTGQYYLNGANNGHHIFSGSSPETGATHLWLDDVGLITGDSVDDVEQANHGHTWPLDHAGGELSITLYDDIYTDNVGPGTKLCIEHAP